MGKRILTPEQIKDLLKNPNVIKCSQKAISYSNGFKIKAVKEHTEQYASAKEIFLRAGFDLQVIGERIPERCLERWNRIYKAKGLERLAVESRGRLGRPKKNLTDADRIRRLEAEVVYLKAENDFLTKLRAKRAE